MSEIIKLHDLRPAKGANKPKRRVGRGEGGKGGELHSWHWRALGGGRAHKIPPPRPT